MLPYKLVCSESGAEYPPQSMHYLSPEKGPETPAGGCLRGVLDIVYDWSASPQPITRESIAASRALGTRRYMDLLPIESPDSLPAVIVGNTPVVPGGRFAEKRGFKHLFFKDDTRNPTGSYKDRASEIVVAKARELGISRITAASTGNAATALSGLCASTGLEAIVFVPAGAPQGKLAQILAYGARVIRVQGTYDDAFDLSLAATERFGWYNRNTAYNPYTIDGKRTAAFEIAEQMGWEVPDVVAVSSGDGVILSGLWKGFKDLRDAGLTDRVPRMLSVQAEGSNSIVRAIREGLDVPPTLRGASSMADSIVVEAPRNGVMAVRDIRESGGTAIDVTEEEIQAGLRDTAQEAGIFCEPSCAATAAGVVKAAEEGLIGRDERIVCVLTGNGLKDVAGTLKCVKVPEPIEPKLEALPADLQV
ncbi:threonine synthase [bacterium]|nr:threonine synthase [bacterium]